MNKKTHQCIFLLRRHSSKRFFTLLKNLTSCLIASIVLHDTLADTETHRVMFRFVPDAVRGSVLYMFCVNQAALNCCIIAASYAFTVHSQHFLANRTYTPSFLLLYQQLTSDLLTSPWHTHTHTHCVGHRPWMNQRCTILWLGRKSPRLWLTSFFSRLTRFSPFLHSVYVSTLLFIHLFLFINKCIIKVFINSLTQDAAQ